MNETERSIPFKCLHEAFFECAYRFPDKTALEWLSLDEKWETLSYEALKIKVLQTASMLKQEGVHTRDKVAIVLPKGENQIIAVLAILSIGATYVPIGIHQPLDRKKKIFEAGNISYALTDKDSDEYVLNLEIKNVLSDIWYMKLETQIPMVQELIRGTVSASNLLTNGYLSPEELLVQGSDTVIFLEHVTKVIKHDSKVAVLGARTGLAVEMLLNNNLDRNVELTLIDESAGMLKRAEERLRRYPLYGRMADTGIIGVLTHDGYMVEAD